MIKNKVIKENLDAIVDEYIAYLNSQEYIDDNFPGCNLKISDKMENGKFDPKFDNVRKMIDEYTYFLMRNKFKSLRDVNKLCRHHRSCLK